MLLQLEENNRHPEPSPIHKILFGTTNDRKPIPLLHNQFLQILLHRTTHGAETGHPVRGR